MTVISKREKIMADKISRLEDIRIKDKFNYNEIQSLSTEARQKLTKIKPRNHPHRRAEFPAFRQTTFRYCLYY